MPTHIVYTLNLLLTLHTGNQITIETESEEKETAQRFIEDKYMLLSGDKDGIINSSKKRHGSNFWKDRGENNCWSQYMERLGYFFRSK